MLPIYHGSADRDVFLQLRNIEFSQSFSTRSVTIAFSGGVQKCLENMLGGGVICGIRGPRPACWRHRVRERGRFLLRYEGVSPA
jgi:hypothetical protein